MDESEKMTTLKKVYADIILNTAKEAAARIMISERKALRFQQEIFTLKDEALSMLVRMKQMMDSKISEAEITALNQRKRTEELEVQLHHAEGIVRMLRTEFKALQDEMKKMKQNPMRLLNEQITRASSDFHEDALQHNKVKASESVDAPLNQIHANAHCPLVRENSTVQRERRSVSSENCFAGNSDLASIIMRNKEPELYRNGCTQRVRAFERLKESDNSDIGAAKRTCTSSRPKDDNMRLTEKNSTNLDNILQQESSLIKEQAAMLPIFSTRKKRSKHRRTSSYNEHDTKARELSDLSGCNTFPGLVNSITESGEDLSKTIEGAQRKLESHLIPVSALNLTNVNLGSDHKDSSGSQAEVTKSEIIQLAAEDTKLIDEAVLTKQETRVTESSDVKLCESKKEDSKSEMTNGTPAPTVNDRLLKYTFQRKRKRESLSIPDNNALLEKNSMPKTMSEEKQSSVPEPKKPSSLVTESSRESRRLMQVARQLISLSVKKW